MRENSGVEAHESMGGVGFVGRGSKPHSTSQGVWRSTVSSPSRVSGGAPAEVEFGARETWHVC